MLTRYRLLFCSCLFAFSIGTSAQAVLEGHQKDIYDFLYRMAQKNVIVFDDLIRPVPRTYIYQKLIEVSGYNKLTSTERKELIFYLKEYTPLPDTAQDRVKFFKRDEYGRWRFFQAKEKDIVLNFDPVISGGRVGGSYRYEYRSVGAQFWGRIGKHIGFQFFVKDVSESGDSLDKRGFSPERGFVLQSDPARRTFQAYSEIRAALSYEWRNGRVTLGQDHFLWGYGDNGRIVSSDKAPTFPFIRLDYRPFKWLQFNYIHGFLRSNIIDTTRRYYFGNNTFGGLRNMYVPKFIASHSITVTPLKGLDISAGENMIYSDRVNIGYLIPFMFFKVFDNTQSSHDILAGSNSQIFLQLSSRGHLKNTHLYSTLLIDEIKVGQIFNRQRSRNQIGFNIGASVTDVFIPYLSFNAEYSRINPFVYRNLNPAQNYTHHDASLGHWMGNNADQLIIGARYTPLPRLKLHARYQFIRKGAAGTMDEQYFAEPQPPFLFGSNGSRKDMYFSASYELMNDLYIKGYWNSFKQNGAASKLYSLGIYYGL